MDARRYDRNADQLSQIFSHFQLLSTKDALAEEIAAPMRQELLEILERALVLNDFMGKLHEKGLV